MLSPRKAKAEKGKGLPLEGIGVARLLSVEAAGLYLSLSKWTLRGLAWSGRLACVKVGRRVLFDREDLDRFIAAHKHQEQP